MKLISWNVNGIRAAARKGLVQFIIKTKPDIMAVQEVKSDYFDMPSELSEEGYRCFINPAKKKGYSGTLIFSRIPGISVTNGIGDNRFDDEGRVQIADVGDIYFVNAYFPNSQRDLARLGFKADFNRLFLDLMLELQRKKPVIACGDFNVAHTDLDIARPKENEGTHGFTKEERESFSSFIEAGLVDTFRIFTRDGGHYSWWSNMNNARQKNIGWRIDYFIASSSLASRITSSIILEDVMGSDHAPIQLIFS
ncbi:MAG: exodeoxyribonuclease III [Thermoplasmataceae archaeon]